MDRFSQIGFVQRINLEWLENIANMVALGNNEDSINIALQELLRNKVSIGGNAARGNRNIMISILKKIWLKVPPEFDSFHKRALDLLNQLSLDQHIILHWGMSIATYPFLSVVAENTGRLLRLQGSASASQVQRRLKEKYGERETVSRAVRRILRNFVQWGVLVDTADLGVYSPSNSLKITGEETISWLIEAVLHSTRNYRLPLKMAFETPMLFPFKLASIPSGTLANYGQIEVISHDLNNELITLKNEAHK
jgi:hypothetical protein